MRAGDASWVVLIVPLPAAIPAPSGEPNEPNGRGADNSLNSVRRQLRLLERTEPNESN